MMNKVCSLSLLLVAVLFCCCADAASVVVRDRRQVQQTPPTQANCPKDWDPSPACVCRDIPSTNTASVYCDNATSGDAIKASFAKLAEPTAFATFSIKDAQQVSALPEAVFGRASFRMFFITHTNLKSVDDNAFKGSELTAESFLLHNNSLENFNFKSLAQLTNLKNFELSGGRLTSLPASAFGDNKKNLEVVVFNDNQISSVGAKIFDQMPKLRTVDLGRNNLTTLPDFAFSMGQTERPVSLLLSHNQIETIGKDAFTNSKLRLLELEDNQLKSLPEGTFSPVVKSIGANHGTFSTLGNPFDCTKADTEWLVRLTPEERSHVIGFTCRNGRHLEEIKSVDELA